MHRRHKPNLAILSYCYLPPNIFGRCHHSGCPMVCFQFETSQDMTRVYHLSEVVKFTIYTKRRTSGCSSWMIEWMGKQLGRPGHLISLLAICETKKFRFLLKSWSNQADSYTHCFASVSGFSKVWTTLLEHLHLDLSIQQTMGTSREKFSWDI